MSFLLTVFITFCFRLDLAGPLMGGLFRMLFKKLTKEVLLFVWVMVQCVVMWCGVVWCDMVWYNVVWWLRIESNMCVCGVGDYLKKHFRCIYLLTNSHQNPLYYSHFFLPLLTRLYIIWFSKVRKHLQKSLEEGRDFNLILAMKTK